MPALPVPARCSSPASRLAEIGAAANGPRDFRRLALRELRGLARFVQARLLALDDPRVARQEPRSLERYAQVRIGVDERASDPVPHGSRLARRPPAVDTHADV